MFSIGLPSFWRRAELRCKVTDLFLNCQIFQQLFFQKFFRADSFRIPGKPALRARKQRFRRDLRPKSECKVRHFERTNQIFLQQISIIFVQST